MHNPATVRLELDSRPESLTLVRGMLAGVGDLLAFESELLDDLKTAISEACNNVVLHAYDGLPGPLVVALGVEEDAVEVLVRDRGGGIQHVAASEDRMGVGLAVISALADRAEFVSGPDGGTDVRMSFAGRGAGVQVLDRPANVSDPEQPLELSGDVVVTLSPVSLLTGVLGRLARALAAGARFSLDRFSDLYLVTDAIAAHAESAANGPWITFAVAASTRRLEIAVGPFRSGTGEQLPDARSPRPESPLALLTDEVSVERTDNSELLRVVMLDHRGDPAGSAG
jgi:anti-sigma regulatory factor (Ser/Thr protein kinase)